MQESFKEFIKDTPYKDAIIIPISAQHKVGVSALIQAIEENLPTPKKDPTKDPLMFVARSFDINKPGILPEKLVGGVLGGTLKQGILKVNEKVEIKPGRKVIEKNREVWKPIYTQITDLKSGNESVKEANPGGSVGVLTSLDPAVVKSDQLTGAIVGLPDKLPKVWHELLLGINLFGEILKNRNSTENIIRIFTALETLLIRDRNEEKRINVAERLAYINHPDEISRIEAFNLVERLYNARSRLVHSGKTDFKEIDFNTLFVELQYCIITIAKLIDKYPEFKLWIDMIQSVKFNGKLEYQ